MIHWLSKQCSYLAKHQFILESLKQPFCPPTEKQYQMPHTDRIISKKNIPFTVEEIILSNFLKINLITLKKNQSYFYGK